MIFYHQHLALGGKLAVVPEALLLYRHHPSATSKAISRGRLMEEKAQHFERQILEHLPADARITIWNAGKDGRKFFMCLSREARASRVHGFCDVDPSKIGTPYYDHDNRLSLPVVHFREARLPVAIWCEDSSQHGSGCSMLTGVFRHDWVALDWIAVVPESSMRIWHR